MKLIPSIATSSWAAGLKVVTCRCEHCQKLLGLRHFAARKAGIKMRDAWYCSSRCFTAAAEKEISRLLTLEREPVRYVERMPLGLGLVSHGSLTIEQLRQATDEQKETGGELGEILVRHGFVTEKQVTAMRATQWGCPVFEVPKHLVRIEINIPRILMQLYTMIPLHYVSATNSLLVGFVHGVEYGVLYAIEQMTGCTTKPCFVTPSDFHTQMQQGQPFGDPLPREVSFENEQTAGEMAKILCASGLEIEADEAFLAKCRKHLWARVKSGSTVVDLLFKAT